jgi:hypothetical protein
LFATVHRRPLLNGYSGFFPASWYANVQRFRTGQWTEETAQFLSDRGVSTIVIDTRAPGIPALEADHLRLGAFELRRELAAASGIEVWRLQRP